MSDRNWHDKPLSQHHREVFDKWRRKDHPTEGAVAIRLSWLRTRAPDAFRYLCLTDVDCASIAVQRKWVFNADSDPQLGWADRNAVTESIRKARSATPSAAKALMDCLHAALERYASENLDLLGA